VQNGTITYAVDTGAADLYAIAPTPAVSAYAVGQTFHFKVINANATTTPTLAVSGLATPGVIKWPNAAALVAGDLPANALVSVTVASISPAVFHLQTVAVPAIRSSILTTRGDLIVEGATVPQRLGLGTVGKVLTSDGTDAVWIGPATVRIQTFSATGTYTPHASMVTCIMEAVGGGGGGAGTANSGGANQIAATGGGGAGGYSQLIATAATVGASQAVTIGAAGAAGSSGANNGGAGGDTSVGSICIGKGGSGGLTTQTGGAGGVAGTGSVTATGAPGGGGYVFSTGGATNTCTTAGGSGPFGGGAIPTVTAGAGTGTAGSGFGSGGGGGASVGGGGAAAGGAGTAGYVKITEYCKA